MRHAAINAASSGNRVTSAASTARAVEHLGKPRARTARRLGRQRVAAEEAVVDDLRAIARTAVLAECAHHEHRHMVAPRHARVEEDAVQHRRLRAPMMPPSSTSSRASASRDGFAGLHPAARQVPARHVAVLDQEDAALRVVFEIEVLRQ